MQDLKKLFRKYIDGKCSVEEIRILFEQLDLEENKHLKEELIRGQLTGNADSANLESGMIQERLDRIFQKILLKIDSPIEGERKVVFMRWWIAAAAILLLIVSIPYIKISRKPLETQIAKVKKPVRTDIPAPALARAILRLDDGQVVDLDSAGKGSLAVQGHVHIIKTAEGQITYSGDEASTTKYNILTNPRGSKVVNLMLVDGTQVWLNAESSLRYPIAFTGKERKVEVTGEAYFEVAHNPKKPFIVSKDSMSIQVLGTHFNVNTYDNETVSKITLLEGSVKVNIKNKRYILAPGQQAQLKDSGIQVVNNINTGEVIAWKNGKFQFSEKTDISTIMRQLARWYDVDVEIRGNVTQHFWGSIPRDITIAQVLQKIESTGGVKFLIEGNKIIVMP